MPRRIRSGVLGAVCAAAMLVQPAVIAQQKPDRTKPPAVGDAPKLVLPPIQKRTLSNGVRVWIVESHEVPVAQVNLVILAGSADDPAGKFGVASLTAAMLDEGAGTRSALELADAIEFLGAALTTGSSFDASAVRLNVPVARLQDGLSLLADVALRPTFPAADLERIRQERLTSLLQARDEPAQIAATAFARLVFGPTHRYGTAAIGNEASISSLAVGDLRAFHAAHFVPSNAAFVVAGAVKADEAVRLLEQQFGSWKGGATARATLPEVPQVKATEIVLVDKPGAAQSAIRIGRVGVARSTPEYFPLQVLNTIFGGSFTSRLNQNLRETHGYAYGASSAFDMRRTPGPFIAASNVQTDKTSEAVREFMNEFAAIRKPVPAEELAKAKNYLALGFPGEFETATDLSQQLESLVVYGLPDDYFSKYMNSVQAVSGDAVLKAATAHLVPDRLLIVVVGDRKVIEPGITSLNLAPVRHMTVAEVFGK